jgi:tetratricopeptide (TPR) repeat protein
MHTNGYATTATKKSLNQARLLMEQAEELGEPLDDPLLLFSVLFGFWVANFNHFHRDVVCGLAVEFLGLAEKQKAIGPMIVAHRLVGSSLLLSGDITKARSHFDQAIALYDPMTHRLLATRFGQDLRVATLCSRSSALWHLGYLESARHDTERALKDAREIGQAATLMFALFYASGNYLHFRDYAPVNSLIDELLLLAEDKERGLVETARIVRSRCPVCSDRKGFKCSADAGEGYRRAGGKSHDTWARLFNQFSWRRYFQP